MIKLIGMGRGRSDKKKEAHHKRGNRHTFRKKRDELWWRKRGFGGKASLKQRSDPHRKETRVNGKGGPRHKNTPKPKAQESERLVEKKGRIDS